MERISRRDARTRWVLNLGGTVSPQSSWSAVVFGERPRDLVRDSGDGALRKPAQPVPVGSAEGA